MVCGTGPNSTPLRAKGFGDGISRPVRARGEEGQMADDTPAVLLDTRLALRPGIEGQIKETVCSLWNRGV